MAEEVGAAGAAVEMTARVQQERRVIERVVGGEEGQAQAAQQPVAEDG